MTLKIVQFLFLTFILFYIHSQPIHALETRNIRIENIILTGEERAQSKILKASDNQGVFIGNYKMMNYIHNHPERGMEVAGYYFWERPGRMMNFDIVGDIVIALIEGGGISFIDVSDIESIQEVNFIEYNPRGQGRINNDILTYDNQILVHYSDVDGYYYTLYDISDIDNIEEIMVLNFEERRRLLAFNEDFIVFKSRNRQNLFISRMGENPSDNVLYQSESPNINFGLLVENNCAVGSSDGVNLLRYANGEWNSFGNILDNRRIACADIQSNLMILADRTIGDPIGLHLFNFEDWENPELLDTYENKKPCSAVFVEDIIYTAHNSPYVFLSQFSFQNFQLSEVDSFESVHYYNNLKVNQNDLYFNGPTAFEISDNRQLESRGYFNFGGEQIGMHNENIICGRNRFDLNHGAFGIFSTRAEDGILPCLGWTECTPQPYGLMNYDDYLILTGIESIWWAIFDISDYNDLSDDPVETFNTAMGHNSVRIGEYLYTAKSDAGYFSQRFDNEFLVYQINNWVDLELLTTVEFNGEVIAEHQGMVLASVYPGQEIAWWNIDDPEEPELEHRCELDGAAYFNNFRLEGNLLYGLHSRGVSVFDIHEPGQANLAGCACHNPELMDSLRHLDESGSWFDVENGLIVAPMHGWAILSYTGPDVIENAEIELVAGWNMISSYIEPVNPNIIDIFNPIVREENLQIVKNGLGQFYIPEWEFNNIPEWIVTQGYQVKVHNDDELEIQGEEVAENRPIDLEEGWSMVAYFPENELNAPNAFANITDQLIIAKDDEGHFYVPEWDFNNMMPLRRGKGYQVNVSEEVEFVWNVDNEEVYRQFKLKFSHHFQIPNISGANMSLLINNVAGQASLPAKGFEIGAFSSDGLLVGSGVAGGDACPTGDKTRCGIAVWGDDPTTGEKDGLKDGEAFRLKLWDSELEKEFDLEVAEVLAGEGLIYKADEFTAIDAAVKAAVPGECFLAQSYPNPFNSVARLTYGLPQAGEVALRIYDCSGRLVETLFDGVREAGYHNAVWNGQDLAAGVYLIRLETARRSLINKAILIK